MTVKTNSLTKATINPGEGRLDSEPRQRNQRARTPISLEIPQIKRKLADMPSRYRGIYRRAMGGNNLRAAIHAQCLECFQWQREGITVCTSKSCPLYPYRPYQ